MSSYNLNIIEQWAERILPVAQKYQPKLFQELLDTIKEKRAADAVDITVYGIYSHGKSTLVNALCGKEDAAMGKAPTTAQVQRYPWRGCQLLDTPGIDAPIEHQAIAEEQLRKSELVLYVLQSTDVEDARAWKELGDIVERKQKTILVVNDFNQCRSKPELMVQLKDGYRTNLQKEGAKRGIDAICNYVPIYFVNAKSALKGKLENKEVLLAASGMNELEDAIYDAVRNVSVEDVMQTLGRNFLHVIQLCESSLCPEDSAKFFQEAQASLESIKSVRGVAASKILRDLDDMLATYRTRIYQEFDAAQDEQVRRTHLARIMEEIGAGMEECVRKALSQAQRRVEDICDNIDKLSSVYVTPHAGTCDADATSGQDSLLQKIPWKDLLQKVNWEASMQTAVVNILKMGKQWLPDLFKGIGAKTMGRWASSFTAVLGPALSVAVAVYDFYKAEKEEEAHRIDAINRAKTLEEEVTSVINSVHKAYADEVNSILDEVFLPVEKKMEENIQHLRINFLHDEKDAKLLTQAREAVNSIVSAQAS